jgi:hypothetical protein
VPKNLKLLSVLAVLLSACGSTAAQVTADASTVNAPATSGSVNTTIPRDDLDDINDVAAIDELGQFLGAADAADHSQIRAVAVGGITLLAADEESVGTLMVSLSATAAGVDGDLAMAVRSGSGTCIWYAFVQGEERFGTGEPCTAAAALDGSSNELSADSPWHLVLDDSSPADAGTKSEAQARAAQSALRNALVVAKTYYSDAGTFAGVTISTLQAIEPTLNFVAADVASSDPDTVSVAFVGDAFGAATVGDNGTCYWITERVGSPTRYGEGMPCTGTAALAASASAWD